jgi:hypothetical protein
MPKNQPTIKMIPAMRKQAAVFFRAPDLFFESASKHVPAIKDMIPQANATNLLLSNAELIGPVN